MLDAPEAPALLPAETADTADDPAEEPTLPAPEEARDEDPPDTAEDVPEDAAPEDDDDDEEDDDVELDDDDVDVPLHPHAANASTPAQPRRTDRFILPPGTVVAMPPGRPITPPV